MQRPDWPRININAPLAGSLLFAGLGGGASTLLMADASGWGNDGTLTNMEPATDWVWDNYLGRFVLDFSSASTQYVDCQRTVLSSSPISVSVWVKLSSLSGVPAIAGTRGAYNSGWVFFILGDNPGDPIAFTMFSIAEYVSLASGLSVGQWTHCAVTYDHAKVRFYINGSLLNETSETSAMIPSENPLFLGAFCNFDGSPSNLYNGSLGDVVIHSRALSPAEIQQLADPSNVMLSGLILPPRRVLWPAVTAPSGDATYNASALNVTSAVVASTPSVTVYPAALEVAAAVVAPIPIISISPSAIDITTSVETLTPLISISLAAIDITTSVETPTPVISISLAAIDITTSVETSTPIISISPSAIDITTSVEASTPVISISPSAIDTTAAVVDPVINTGENITFQASPLSIVAEISGLPLRVNRTLNLVN